MTINVDIWANYHGDDFFRGDDEEHRKHEKKLYELISKLLEEKIPITKDLFIGVYDDYFELHMVSPYVLTNGELQIDYTFIPNT